LEFLPEFTKNGEPDTGVRTPSAAIVNASTEVPSIFASPTKRKLLVQSMSTPAAKPVPMAGNGDPGTGESVPSVAMLNIPTASFEIRATARNLPSGETLMPSGVPPAGKGEPGTGLSEPLAAMLNIVIVAALVLAATRNRPSGVEDNEMSLTTPVAKGDPGTDVRVPAIGSIEKALMLDVEALVAYKYPLTVEIVARFTPKKPPFVPIPPVENGEPGSRDNAPPIPTENAETVLVVGEMSLLT
jgi:hypothetical protein